MLHSTQEIDSPLKFSPTLKRIDSSTISILNIVQDYLAAVKKVKLLF